MLIFLDAVSFLLAEFVVWYNQPELSGLWIFLIVPYAVGIFSITISSTIPGTGLLTEDPRIWFIYEILCSLNNELENRGSSLCTLKGDPEEKYGQKWVEDI